jgi:hypothetical protein
MWIDEHGEWVSLASFNAQGNLLGALEAKRLDHLEQISKQKDQINKLTGRLSSLAKKGFRVEAQYNVSTIAERVFDTLDWMNNVMYAAVRFPQHIDWNRQRDELTTRSSGIQELLDKQAPANAEGAPA